MPQDQDNLFDQTISTIEANHEHNYNSFCHQNQSSIIVTSYEHDQETSSHRHAIPSMISPRKNTLLCSRVIPQSEQESGYSFDIRFDDVDNMMSL